MLLNVIKIVFSRIFRDCYHFMKNKSQKDKIDV